MPKRKPPAENGFNAVKGRSESKGGTPGLSEPFDAIVVGNVCSSITGFLGP